MPSRFQTKHYLLQLFSGVAAALLSSFACVAVRLFLQWLQRIFTGHAGLLPEAAAGLPPWRRLLTPMAGAGAALFITWMGRRIQRSASFKEYLEEVRSEGGRISFIPTLWRTTSSAFSVATGAAIGREGSMIQFAAAVTSLLGQRLRSPALPLPKQVACGVAAAVATVYQAPLAGIFFASEIVMGKIIWRQVPLLAVSAYIGMFVSRPILGGGPLFPTGGTTGIDFSHAWLTVPLAILLGALGPLYCWLLQSMDFARKWPLALLWSGTLVGVLSLSRTEVWGNGDAAIMQMMHPDPAVKTLLLILALRLCATAFCVGTGTAGGVFTPTLFAGSALGFLFSRLLHTPNPLLFTVLGMSCLLAAAAHAPWMAALVATELTGQWELFPLLLPCCLLAGRIAESLSPRSLYGVTVLKRLADFPRKELPFPSPAARTEIVV